MGVNLWSLSLLSYYVGIDTVVIVASKVSAQNGKISYNTCVAVLCVEIAKLCGALVFLKLGLFTDSNAVAKDHKAQELRVVDLEMGGESGLEDEEKDTRETSKIVNSAAAPGGKKHADRRDDQAARATTWGNYCRYGVPSFVYFLNNNINIHAISYVGVGSFALFNSSKVLFAALCNRVILKQSVSQLQWQGLGLLFVSLVCAKFDVIKEVISGSGESSGSQSAWAFTFGICLVFLTSLLSGLSGTLSEFLIKGMDTDVPPMRKNTWMYQWGIFLNFCSFLSLELWNRENYDDGKAVAASEGSDVNMPFHPYPPLDTLVRVLSPTHVFRGFNAGACVYIFAMATFGLSVSLVLQYFDNVVRAISGVLPILLAVVIGVFFFDEPLSPQFVVGLVLFIYACYLYNKGKAPPEPAASTTGEKSGYALAGRNTSEGDAPVRVEMKGMPAAYPVGAAISRIATEV
ncbi:unnamed protein product [Amoebophrya sp. A25]|nr:unnamed protein product [Amoebophrya sp. A25]|eukprot:GSA25T00000404001.1